MRQQRLLFSELRTEMARLQAFENNIIDNCPRVDAFLYQQASKAEHGSGTDEEHNLPQLSKLKLDWSYEMFPISYRKCRMDYYSIWQKQHLVAESPDSNLFVGSEEEALASLKGCGAESHLQLRISPHLLLHRLTFMFDIPPRCTEKDIFAYPVAKYKTTWSAALYNKDDVSSFLLFEKGGNINVEFMGEDYGERSAHDQALELLNFLCGKTFPHGDDEV